MAGGCFLLASSPSSLPDASFSSSRRCSREICPTRRRICFPWFLPQGGSTICGSRGGRLRQGIHASAQPPSGDRGEEEGNDSTESLFLRELKRRGISSTSSDSSASPSSREPSSAAQSASASSPADPRFGSGRTGQREVSQALSGEGLEGLPSRALALLRLGASFPLATWPLAAATLAAFLGLYLVFGADFIHIGPTQSPSPIRPRPPPIDPYELLAQEEQLLPRVPFRQ